MPSNPITLEEDRDYWRCTARSYLDIIDKWKMRYELEKIFNDAARRKRERAMKHNIPRTPLLSTG